MAQGKERVEGNACVDCGGPVADPRCRLCRSCYIAAPRSKTDPLERFWDKVDLNGPLWNGTPCWLWTSAHDKDGYGAFWGNDRFGRAHRFAYETYVGPIPEGLEIDHLCRNRACQNWAHMEPVTCQVNLLRGIGPSAVNAAKTHCPQGHPYDELNTIVVRTGRQCRACNVERKRQSWPAMRAHANEGRRLRHRAKKKLSA